MEAMLRIACLLLCVSGVSTAFAQDDPALGDPAVDAEVPPSDGGGDTGGNVSTELADEQALTEEQVGVEEPVDSTDPSEDPIESYHFLGAFYNHIFIPDFIVSLFVESDPDPFGGSNPFVGLEYTYRKDSFDIVVRLAYMGAYGEGFIRANGDPFEDTEHIDVNLNLVMASATFLWSTNFDEQGIFAFQYGIGVGLGVVFGDLTRTEAYRDASSGNEWAPCAAVGNPNPTFCDGPSVGDGENGGHYNVEARFWAEGGSIPNIFPWFALPHLAIRIKPIHQLMMRVEGGWSVYGFFVGGSAAYGF
jgi:hypothetical protein